MTAGTALERKRFGVFGIAVLGAAFTNLLMAGQLAWTMYAPGSDASSATFLRRMMSDYGRHPADLNALIFGPVFLSVCLLVFLWWRWQRPTRRNVGSSFLPLLLTVGLVVANLALIQGPGMVALTIPLLAIAAIIGVLERARE